jgi:hypothetical protein
MFKENAIASITKDSEMKSVERVKVGSVNLNERATRK